MKTLHLYDYTDNLARRLGFAAEYCEDYDRFADRCVAAKEDVLHAGVASLADVLKTINAFGKRNKRLAGLVFHTHGSPGRIYLPDGSIDATNVERLQEACGKYLMPGATVVFYGCNVAEGMWGIRFMETAGKNMLGLNGGWIAGSENITLSVPSLGQRSPVWADHVVYWVAPGGDVMKIEG